ncbi:uncharacterized protein LOC102207576 [Pundamilia nyererei]|uniref:Uncharacterized protein LOC102207576 n=1 Tax=Pundamilia nyererei TaxID=303518 RepID=A0A9Y3S8C1_9CICH|nr:PREDICTED: uncharacterized protein LOC102207576 [Pundamilia nyererei]
MPEIERNYQALLDMEQEQVLWKKFYVWKAGRTNGAHSQIVQKLKDIGHTEVDSPEDCDYLLGFCPIASRVGTDIIEALNNKPLGKPVILVVMHHTHDTRRVVAKSSRQVYDPDVCLTVDCLFYNGILLNCSLNDNMWAEIKNHFGVLILETQGSDLLTRIVNWIKNHLLIVALIIAFIFVIILVTLTRVDKVEHAHAEGTNKSSSTNKTYV